MEILTLGILSSMLWGNVGLVNLDRANTSPKAISLTRLRQVTGGCIIESELKARTRSSLINRIRTSLPNQQSHLIPRVPSNPEEQPYSRFPAIPRPISQQISPILTPGREWIPIYDVFNAHTHVYFNSSVKRGIRMINGRKQVLLQDDITNANVTSEWRMHTNATISVSGATATLTMPISGKKLITSILNAPNGVAFSTGLPQRYSTDPPLPSGDINQDQPNPGVTVLLIEIPIGTSSIQVLFNPQWDGMTTDQFKTPPSVPIDNWSLTSHN